MKVIDSGRCTVAPTESCDICKLPAPYYSMQWFIHYCSDECFAKFLCGIDQEVDSVAREWKNLDDLFPKKDPPDEV